MNLKSTTLTLLMCFSLLSQHSFAMPGNVCSTRSPLLFTENKGQVMDVNGQSRHDILYTADHNGMKVYVSAGRIYYRLTASRSENCETVDGMLTDNIYSSSHLFSVQLIGSNNSPVVIPEKASGCLKNFYLPVCPKGVIGVKSYEQVTMKDIYPGIDWVLYTQEGHLKYDFVVHGGADPAQIRFKVSDADRVTINTTGDLEMQTKLGVVKDIDPVSFCKGVQVSTAFELKEDVISFKVGNYDKTNTLIIDPSVVWGTYFGTGDDDWAVACNVDASGNIYVGGYTTATSGIATTGGFQEVYGGGLNDAFLAKYNSDGIPQWITYYGGIDDDRFYSCRVLKQSGSNSIYVAGLTESQNGLADNGHLNSLGSDTLGAILVKFDSNGLRDWATYYGYSGSVYEYLGVSCGVDDNERVYLAGRTRVNSGIATPGAFQTSLGGGRDGYLAKFDTDGNRLWATYIGGNSDDGACYCEADQNGNIYICGTARSGSQIASFGHQGSFGGGFSDAYLMKFTSSGNKVWGTYYGGNGSDEGYHCATDDSGNVYLSGGTTSTDNIAFNGFFNTGNGTSKDAFLVKFNGAGVRQWATYYGGSSTENGWGCGVDDDYNVYLSGNTLSSSSIATSDGFKTSLTGSTDGYLVKFTSNGDRVWATYYGGNLTDAFYGFDNQGDGTVYVAGQTSSTANMAYNAYQSAYGGGQYDGFLYKISGVPNDVKQISMASSLSVYPNPVSDQLFIKGAFNTTSAKHSLVIGVMDMLGQEIKAINATLSGQEFSYSIDFGSEIPDGVYFIRVCADGEISGCKIVVMR